MKRNAHACAILNKDRQDEQDIYRLLILSILYILVHLLVNGDRPDNIEHFFSVVSVLSVVNHARQGTIVMRMTRAPAWERITTL
jgi:hypothetical protein